MKNNFKLKYLVIKLPLLLLNFISYSQSGLNFQGVARTSNNVILASQAVSIKLSILQGSSNGSEEYSEIKKINTNAQGLFNVVIGDTGYVSKSGNYNSINWKLTPKFLKIELDPTGGNNFVYMGTTQFQYVAYAHFAKNVDAENIVGIVPVSQGGTGVNSISNFKTVLAVDKINNTSDILKPISTATQNALDLKLNLADTIKYVKKSYVDSALIVNSTADANTLSGSTLKSSIINSSLTSVGILSDLVVNSTITAGAVIYPKIHGSNGQFLSTTGSGTLTWTTINTSSNSSLTYSIGSNSDLGGYIFFITPDGKHGLVASGQDQTNSCKWYDADLDISIPSNYNDNGKKFTDWRLPTKHELNLMWLSKSNIGGFSNGIYWSSSESGSLSAWSQSFNNGSYGTPSNKDSTYSIRAIRSF